MILQLILVFTQIQLVDSTCLGCEWLLPELTRGLLLKFLLIDRSNDDIQPARAFFSVTKARDMAIQRWCKGPPDIKGSMEPMRSTVGRLYS